MAQVIAGVTFLKPFALSDDMVKKIITQRIKHEGPDYAKSRGWDLRDFPKHLTLIQITELKAVLFKKKSPRGGIGSFGEAKKSLKAL